MAEKTNGCAPSTMAADHIRWLTEFDEKGTNYLAATGLEYEGRNWFRVALKLMEWSMHGVVWLTIMGYCFYTTRNIHSIPVFTNIILALIFDLIVIGCVKLAFRRRRPVHNRNDMIAEAPFVDQFSFPSGHSSRGAMMTRILLLLAPMERSTMFCVLLYPVALALSRVMLGRHYFSDVVAGLLIGALEGELVGAFWLSEETCVDIARHFRSIPE